MIDDPALTRQLAQIMGWTIYGSAVLSDWLARVNTGKGDETAHIDKQGCVWVCPAPSHVRRPWRPLHDMGDAWMVVERLEKELWGMTLTRVEVTPEGRKRFHLDKWFCRFTGFDTEVEAIAPSPQRAICEAALKTVENTASNL